MPEVTCAQSKKEAGEPGEKLFHFEAVDAKGNKVKREVWAEDRDDAMAKVKGMGLFPTKVQGSQPRWNPWLAAWR